jgi:hypothetical protein
MSQHDYAIADADGLSFLADLNNNLAAIVSNNSGATAPAVTYAYMLWTDTTSGLLKQRNAANSAWINKGTLSATDWGYAPLAGATFTGDITMSAASIIEAEGAEVASAAGAINIWATDGNTRHITGNLGPITNFGTASQAGMWMKLIFDGTPTLTNSANLNLNSATDIVIQAGDIAFVYADTTTQNDVFVIRKSGEAVVDSSVVFASNAEYQTGTETAKAVSPAVARAHNIVQGTSIATTSGTSHDYASIPSWAKRITVEFSEVGTNGTSLVILQLGTSSGIEVTGYLSLSSNLQNAAGVGVNSNLTGFHSFINQAAQNRTGSFVLTLISGNTWIVSGGLTSSAVVSNTTGNKTLIGALDRIRLTTVNGTDIFDNGSINIKWE